MQHHYAQINHDGICIGESQLSAPVENDHLIPIAQADGSHLGRRWENGEWHDVPQPEPPIDTRITRLAFRNRYTAAEKVALEIAALDDPSADMPQRQQAAALRAHLKDLDAANWVDLTRPETIAAVQSLESAGLLATGRAAQILDVDSITDIERHTP